MDASTAAPAGYLSSLRTLGDGLLASVQDRLELFSVEVHEEKFRLIQIFIWISAAVFTGMMVATFASLTLVYVFWDSARLSVLAALTLFYGSAFAAIAVAFRRYLARQPKPFAATLSEIKEDRSCIQSGN